MSSNAIQYYPLTVFIISINIFILFIVSTASIDHCNNKELNDIGMAFSIISMLLALTLIIYSGFVAKEKGIFGYSFGKRYFGRF